jgi:aminoglycoside 6'-N-acetyltransferase
VTVQLQPLAEEHVQAVVELMAVPDVREWWGDYDADRVRRELIDDDESNYLAILLDARLVGIIGWYEEDDPDYRHAGMDISVHPDVFGTGVALDALRAVARMLIDERGHHRLIIDPNAANPRAIAAYRKLGFKPVGVMRRYERNRHGEWTDGLLMDLLADELT